MGSSAAVQKMSLPVCQGRCLLRGLPFNFMCKQSSHSPRMMYALSPVHNPQTSTNRQMPVTIS